MIDKSTANITSQINNPLDDNESNVLAIWRTLALRISHEPQNLKLHTQRLLFGLENDLSEYIAGALQDLFICLQQKGLPLRQRMFNLLSPVMVQSDRAYFQRWLADDSDRNLKCQHHLGAVYKSETCEPLESEDQGTDTNNGAGLLEAKLIFNTSVDEARYDIECGQIGKAQALLEIHCLKNENDHNASNDLQAIYTYTKQKQALDEFTQRFVEKNNALTKTWSTLLDASKSW